MLYLAIPDEVAQYAEGHRITSYFALRQTKEGNSIKNDWLWTTITKGLEPYEFDSFRVFVWSQRRHRYETAYIERNVRWPLSSGSRSHRLRAALLSDAGIRRWTAWFEKRTRSKAIEFAW